MLDGVTEEVHMEDIIKGPLKKPRHPRHYNRKIERAVIPKEKKKRGRPTLEEEFKKMVGLPADVARELIDGLLVEAIEKHHKGKTELQEIIDFIDRAIYPLLYGEIKRGLLGDKDSRRYILDKRIPKASEDKTAETPKRVTILLQKDGEVIDVTPTDNGEN